MFIKADIFIDMVLLTLCAAKHTDLANPVVF